MTVWPKGNNDPAVAIVRRWLTPSRAGLRPGQSRETSHIERHFHALVAAVRAALAGGQCASCGRGFCDERDIWLDHGAVVRQSAESAPPARHRWLLCGRCSWNARYMQAARWIDEEVLRTRGVPPSAARRRSRRRATPLPRPTAPA
jgi:hypothetical protein